MILNITNSLFLAKCLYNPYSEFFVAMIVCMCIITYREFVYLQILFYLTLVITSIKSYWFHYYHVYRRGKPETRKEK